MHATEELPTLFAQAHVDPAVRERLVRRYLPLVTPLARHLAGGRADLVEDLAQVGAIGLLRALERYEPARGLPFEAYAKPLIAGEMRHYLRDAVPLVRPPRELVELRSRVMAAQALLLQAGEAPDAAAIAAACELPVAKVEEVLALEHQGTPASIDAELEAEHGSFGYQLVDARYKSFQLAAEDRIMVASALSKLRAASREVIEFAYYEDLTQTEIAKKLGISQMQVSRRLKAAMGELWKALNTKLF